MKYKNGQRILSTALLLALTVSSGFAYPTRGYDSYKSDNTPLMSSSASLAGNVTLTQNNEKITLSLRDSDVKQVLRMFADKAGKNIVFHNSVNGKVTLDLVDMPINDAFGLVLQITNLNYYLQDNTLVIIAKNNAENASFSKQEMMTFPVKYVSASSIATFLNKNVFGMKKAGVSGVEAATVNSATNEVIVFGMPSDAAIVRKVISILDKEPASRTFIVNHTTPAQMADMVCNLLLPAHGVGTSSGGSGSDGYTPPPTPGISTGSAAGIVTGGADSIKLGEGVIACTMKQSASGSGATAFDAQNLAISYYPQRGSIMMIGGSEAQQQLVEKFIKENDIKQPQAYIEMSIVELNEAGSKEFQNNWALQSKFWNVSFNNGVTSGGRAAGYMDQYIAVPTRLTVKDGQANETYTLGTDYKTRPELIGGGSYLTWQMNYLIENRKARVLANPKIIITNGQESVIDLTEDYVEKVTSEFLSSYSNGTGQGTASTGAVQRTYSIGDDKGIKVSLVPFISPDGYVTLNIKPEYATEAGQVTTPNSTGGNDIQATLLNRRNLDLKNIRIKDGETLIIGGLIQETEQKTVQKVPLLGDLPVIGAAFRSTVSAKAKSELVIMLTPKIIKDGDDTVADRL